MDAEPKPASTMPGAARSYSMRLVVGVALIAGLLGGVVGFLLPGPSGPVEYDVAAPRSASPAPPTQLRLGETGDTPTGSKITVLTWDKGFVPGEWPSPPPGYIYSRAVVKFCSGPGVWNFRVREIPYLFNLVDANPDAGQPLPPPLVDTWHHLEEFASYSQAVLSPDECVTGSIIFASNDDADIRAVRFTGHGRYEWDVRAIDDGTSPAPRPRYSPGPSIFRPGDPTQTPASEVLSPVVAP